MAHTVTGGPPVIATFFIAGPVEEPNPLSVRRDEHALWRAKTAQHRGLELVERTYQQLVVAAIDDA